MVKLAELKSPVIREYAVKALAAHAEESKWNAEASKQWCVQWPGAWADEQIKARQS